MVQRFVYTARLVDIGAWPSFKEGTTDGDTMKFSVDLGFRIYPQFRYRIKDFDAPEMNSKNAKEVTHAKKARKRAKELLQDGDVLIKTTPDPKIYGRWEATIQLPDGRDFATVMKEEGLAKKKVY